MTNEEIKALGDKLQSLSEPECDYLQGRQSKVSFPYVTDLNGLGQLIEGMADEEVVTLVDYVTAKPQGPGNGKRKIRKN